MELSYCVVLSFEDWNLINRMQCVSDVRHNAKSRHIISQRSYQNSEKTVEFRTEKTLLENNLLTDSRSRLNIDIIV
jgi:hypothetical protein